MTENTIPGIFLARVKKYADRVALREKEFGIWQEISWNEYCCHVRHFCLGLLEMGIEKGDHVSIFGENEPEWLYADLGIQSAGAVAVGVYPANPSKEARYVIGHSESIFVICDTQEQVDKVLEARDQLPRLQRIIVTDMKGLRRYTEPMIISFENESQRCDPLLLCRVCTGLRGPAAGSQQDRMETDFLW